MQFFIAVTALLIASAAYLVYQFRTRAFVPDDAVAPAPEAEAAPAELKAA